MKHTFLQLSKYVSGVPVKINITLMVCECDSELSLSTSHLPRRPPQTKVTMRRVKIDRRCPPTRQDSPYYNAIWLPKAIAIPLHAINLCMQ